MSFPFAPATCLTPNMTYVVIICFIQYSQGVLSSLQKLPTRSLLPLIVTVFIVRRRQLQMTKNENSSQIIPTVKHW